MSKDKQKQLRKGHRIALVSTLLIFFLALLKAFIGYKYDSSLLVADAWHSATDILINLSSLIGLKLASMKKSKKFPYGLYRAETIACLIIGVLIVFIGIDLAKEGWQKLFLIDAQKGFPIFPISVSVVSCAVAYVLAVKQHAIGKAIGSQALLATAKEAFFDIFTSGFVLIGIVFVYAQIPFVEGIIILVIAGLIIKLGIETAWKSIMILMDADMDVELKIEIEKKLNRINGIKDVDGLKIRQSGPYKIVDCIIKTDAAQTLYKSHELADIVENMLLTTYDQIESVFIHVEPERKSNETAVIPVLDKKGLESRLYKHFGRAPYFMILNLGNGRIEIDTYITNDFLDKKGHIGLNVVKSIIDYKISLSFASSIGEIAFHYLKNNYVDIFQVDEEMKVKEIVNLYRMKKLDPFTRPHLSKQTF